MSARPIHDDHVSLGLGYQHHAGSLCHCIRLTDCVPLGAEEADVNIAAKILESVGQIRPRSGNYFRSIFSTMKPFRKAFFQHCRLCFIKFENT